MKKQHVLIAITMVVAAFGVLGVARVNAQATTAPKLPTIIELLTQRFGLKQTDVQSVFDNARTARMEARLTQLVRDGQITEAQKTAILVKQKELQNWATQNNISPRYLVGGLGMGHKMMHW